MALTAQNIVAAARRLLTEYGLQDVTMRRLAAELVVQPGALYYHVPSKQELLRKVAHQVLEPLESSEAAPLSLMLRFREALLPLRDGGDLVLIAYALDPKLPPVLSLRRSLELAGASAQAAERRSSVVMDYAVGAIAVEQNRSLLSPQDASMVPPVEEQESMDASRYTEGLRLLLAG